MKLRNKCSSVAGQLASKILYKGCSGSSRMLFLPALLTRQCWGKWGRYLFLSPILVERKALPPCPYIHTSHGPPREISVPIVYSKAALCLLFDIAGFSSVKKLVPLIKRDGISSSMMEHRKASAWRILGVLCRIHPCYFAFNVLYIGQNNSHSAFDRKWLPLKPTKQLCNKKKMTE